MPRQPHHMMGSNWPFVPDENDPNFDPIEDGLNRAGRSMRLRPTEPEPFGPTRFRTPFDPEEILVPQGSAFAWDNVRMRMEQQAGNVQQAPDLQDDGTEKIGEASPIVGGTGQSNDIQSFAARNEALEAHRQAKAPRVRPYSRGSGRLSTAVVAPQVVYTNDAVIPASSKAAGLNWVSADVDGGDPQLMTLGFTAMASPGNTGYGNAVPPAFRPFVKVSVGTLAGLITFFVDAMPGGFLTLAGSMINCEVGQQPVPEGQGRSRSAADALVTVCLSPGSFGSSIPPRYTQYVDDLGYNGLPATSTYRAIPPLAARLNVIRTNPNASDITVKFYYYSQQQGAGGECGTVVIAAGQYQQQPIPIPADAGAVAVTTGNSGGVGTVLGCDVKLIWDLSL